MLGTYILISFSYISITLNLEYDARPIYILLHDTMKLNHISKNNLAEAAQRRPSQILQKVH